MSKPLLSIGMIFRNDIRCIERCLKALQPLRDAVPCELVMADTGSEDGSREIAEKYADILLDFPWVNDFSAARNAVVERCSGEWYLCVDTDEYLDPDFSMLPDFLRQDRKEKHTAEAADACIVIVRNYQSFDMNDAYADFMATRMFRMSLGVHYEGLIHEHVELPGAAKFRALQKVIFHHDGYVGLGDERGKAKRERNLALLREEMERRPDDLLTLVQYLESGGLEDDYTEKLDRAVKLVREHCDNWQAYGPSAFRHYVLAASRSNLPDLMERVAEAEKLFQDSAFTQVDVNHAALSHCLVENDYEEAILRGERYLKALDGVRDNTLDPIARAFGILQFEAPSSEHEVRYCLATAYLRTGDPQRAEELLCSLDYTVLDGAHSVRALQVLREVHAGSHVDTAPAINRMWNSINMPVPSEEAAEKRRHAVLTGCKPLFDHGFWAKEREQEDFCRYSYTMLLPLRKECDLGRAAALLTAANNGERERILTKVENWDEFPTEALADALIHGAQIPPAVLALPLETLDNLATRLVKDQNILSSLVRQMEQSGDNEDLAGLNWRRGIAMAAIQSFNWTEDTPNVVLGLDVARLFARTEDEFLRKCYTPEVLNQENLHMLPPLHRFGFYCTLAFDALEQGSSAEYVHLLRIGLESFNGMKNVVKFLRNHNAEVQQLLASPELKAMADQVRVILARFDPNDPAVAALKQSEAYQKVAYLIEQQENT